MTVAGQSLRLSLFLCHLHFAASHIAWSAALSFFCTFCPTFETLSASITASVSINHHWLPLGLSPVGTIASRLIVASCSLDDDQLYSTLQVPCPLAKDIHWKYNCTEGVLYTVEDHITWF